MSVEVSPIAILTWISIFIIHAISEQFIDDFLAIAKSIPKNEGQRKIIEYIGNSGGKEIVDILVREWNL